jgi:ArsR family transcriptional regulator, lead/cadmium/zinc/bismuth-responsive transcriptional repressor
MMVDSVGGWDRTCDEASDGDCDAQQIALLDEETATRLATTFSVLSDPTRVRIIGALADGVRCVHELSDALGLTHSAVSHQLATLREMHLVTNTKEGRHVYYTLDDEHINDLYRQGLAHVLHAERLSARDHDTGA